MSHQGRQSVSEGSVELLKAFLLLPHSLPGSPLTPYMVFLCHRGPAQDLSGPVFLVWA